MPPIHFKKCLHQPRTLGAPTHQVLFKLEPSKKREEWCSNTGLLTVIGNKTLMHLRMCKSTDAPWEESSSIKHSALIWSSWAFMTLPPQADPLVHPWNTSTAGSIWKIFSKPWSWFVKHLPRWCSCLPRVTTTENWWVLAQMRLCSQTATKDCRYLEHKSSKQTAPASGAWRSHVLRLALCRALWGGDSNAAKNEKVHYVLFHCSANFLVLLFSHEKDILFFGTENN